MTSLEQTLAACGLTASDIQIYQLISQAGKIDVTRIINRSQLSRGTVYEALHNLEKNVLVEYTKVGRSVVYQITHPQNLLSLTDAKQKEAEVVAYDMQKHIEQLTGQYNISIGKPGVQFYEGEVGLKTALFDSLKTKDTIYTYVNENIVQQYAKQLDDQYYAERIRRGIHQHIIFSETASAKQVIPTLKNALTQSRVLDAKLFPFETALEIYDDTITYLTVHNHQFIAAVIQHPGIAQFHKALFKFTWQQLPNSN